MALKRVWIASPNCSGRSGSGVRLVVVHTAEGARSYRDLGNFFASRSAQVSSHTGIDDERGTIGEYVHRPDKAWTQAAYNSQAVSTELCAAPINSPYPCGARWTAEEWSRHPNMLANLADWIREECAHYGLPINKLSSSQAQGGARGVCGHVDLGAGGGGHYDPGPNFPWARVMTLARGGKPDIPAGTPSQENDMICSALNAAGALHVFAAKDKKITYTWQNANQTGWNDAGGGAPAGMSLFATAPDNIVGIDAAVNDGGVIHVFAHCANAKTYYTWQKGSSWNGGKAGVSPAGLILFAN